MSRRHLAVALVALAPLLGGCGASESEEALSETAEKLSEIRSGELAMKVLAEGEGDTRGNAAGFQLNGPFSIDEGAALPAAKLSYTQIAGELTETVEVISTGERAYVETGGTVYELGEDQVAELEGAPTEGALTELEIGDWFVSPEITDGGEIDGVATDRVSGEFDVDSGLNDLISIADSSGGLPLVEDEGAEQLERAIESATIEVYTGAEDRLLRRLLIELDLGLEGVSELQGAAPETGARISFAVELGDLNEPVEIDEPADAVPYPGA